MRLRQSDSRFERDTSWASGMHSANAVYRTDRMSFLEDLFLCGFQTAQSAAGLTPDSPDFVVDVHIELARNGMHATGEIQSWQIRRKDGTSERLEFKLVSRSDRRQRPSAKPGNAKGQGA